jgi:hypothetical protein
MPVLILGSSYLVHQFFSRDNIIHGMDDRSKIRDCLSYCFIIYRMAFHSNLDALSLLVNLVQGAIDSGNAFQVSEFPRYVNDGRIVWLQYVQNQSFYVTQNVSLL